MRKNQNKKENTTTKASDQSLFEALLVDTKLEKADCLDIHKSDCVCIIRKEKMTALELVDVITTLSNMATHLTVALATACGLCTNCGEPTEESPSACVANCSLCKELLEDHGPIQLPAHVLEEAGLTEDTKLEAWSDGDGEIVVKEAEIQQGIEDVPLGILQVLAHAGVCLGELDELILLNQAVYEV